MKPTRAQIVEMWMQDALALMESTIRPQHHAVKTHQVLMVEGWNDSAVVRTAIARYLVGLRVCAIDAGLAIRADLTNMPSGKAEVVSNVQQIIGQAAGSLSAHEIAHYRNPWIAEGIWHLCLAVARNNKACHPPGKVVAVNLPHPKTTDHGIDLAALYHTKQGYGLSIIESKAYAQNIANAVHKSVEFFRKVDDGAHSDRLRQTVSVLRRHLPPANQKNVSADLWQQRRTYIPNPHYDTAEAVDWTNPRPALSKLVPGAAGVFVMPHGIQSFPQFFERIAEKMRAAAASL